MTDVKAGPNPLYLREDQLHEAMELLFFAYRDFTTECDAILALPTRRAIINLL